MATESLSKNVEDVLKWPDAIDLYRSGRYKSINTCKTNKELMILLFMAELTAGCIYASKQKKKFMSKDNDIIDDAKRCLNKYSGYMMGSLNAIPPDFRTVEILGYLCDCLRKGWARDWQGCVNMYMMKVNKELQQANNELRQGIQDARNAAYEAEYAARDARFNAAAAETRAWKAEFETEYMKKRNGLL
jgi:hypothetical protein